MANSVEDYLIDGLSFKMKGGASYITDRRSVTFHPSGSNIYKPTGGTKLIKLNITGDNWLDPCTCRIMYDLRNNGTVTNVVGTGNVEQILRQYKEPQLIVKLFRAHSPLNFTLKVLSFGNYIPLLFKIFYAPYNNNFV